VGPTGRDDIPDLVLERHCPSNFATTYSNWRSIQWLFDEAFCNQDVWGLKPSFTVTNISFRAL